jgi:D-ribulokinase
LTGLALGIDVGTSGVRIVAFDIQGTVSATAAVAMPAPQRSGAQIMQDPGVWWSAVREGLSEIVRKIDGKAVKAVAVDGTSGTVLAVDDGGEPLALARMYNDSSAAEEARLIADAAPPTTAAHGASSPLGKAMMLQRIPGAVRILHQADWILGRLSGRFDVSDESNALKTGYDPVVRRWPDWIGKTGMMRHLLPDVLPVGTSVARISGDLAGEFGLNPQTAMVTGATDGCAAFLATGAGSPGDGVTSLGSTLTIKLLTGAPIFAPQYGIYSHRIGEMWLAGGASNSGGAVLLSFFPKERLRELEPQLEPEKPTGLDYYPLAAPGERFPFSDPKMAPRVTPRPADDRLFLQGLLEGIANVEATGYRRLAELGATPLASLRTVGGGASNGAWSKIRQTKLAVPFVAAAAQEAAAGAARLAWRGIGVEIGA